MTEAGVIKVGTASRDHIRWVHCGGPITGGLNAITSYLTHRDWDVTDASARDVAGREEFGTDYDWYLEHPLCAQWWIRPDENLAFFMRYECTYDCGDDCKVCEVCSD